MVRSAIPGRSTAPEDCAMATAAPVIYRTGAHAPEGAWRKWFTIVAVGEFVGFAVPLIAGVVASQAFDIGGFALWGIVLAAGTVEGLILGVAQASALKHLAPSVNSTLWVVATVAGAAIAWGFMWLIPTYWDRGEPAGIIAGISFLAIPVALLALTVPQAEVLNLAKVRLPYLWLAYGTLAWTVAVPLVFLGGLFVDDSSSTAAVLAAFGAGGVLMALAYAAISGWAIAWMTAHTRPAD
jgi:hypothetical protein